MISIREGETIFRYEVPVDDKWHAIELDDYPVHVGCRDVRVVEFWARYGDEGRRRKRLFRVVGTGHAMPKGAWRYVGTAVAGELVWHLIEGSGPGITWETS
jgi:hypothetical protein